MGILDRFTDIIKANINDLLDKAEDPAKMIDQYMRELTDNLADVKKETAAVMAEEARVAREVKANEVEVAKYDAEALRRLLVKPGLTGLWQISGRSDLSWASTVALDRHYVENRGGALDAKIFAGTLRAVIGGKGAY